MKRGRSLKTYKEYHPEILFLIGLQDSKYIEFEDING